MENKLQSLPQGTRAAKGTEVRSLLHLFKREIMAAWTAVVAEDVVRVMRGRISETLLSLFLVVSREY